MVKKKLSSKWQFLSCIVWYWTACAWQISTLIPCTRQETVRWETQSQPETNKIWNWWSEHMEPAIPLAWSEPKARNWQGQEKLLFWSLLCSYSEEEGHQRSCQTWNEFFWQQMQNRRHCRQYFGCVFGSFSPDYASYLEVLWHKAPDPWRIPAQNATAWSSVRCDEGSLSMYVCSCSYQVLFLLDIHREHIRFAVSVIPCRLWPVCGRFLNEWFWQQNKWHGHVFNDLSDWGDKFLEHCKPNILRSLIWEKWYLTWRPLWDPWTGHGRVFFALTAYLFLSGGSEKRGNGNSSMSLESAEEVQ